MRKSYLLGGALLAAALFVTTSCKEVMGSLDNPVKPYIELEKTTATLEYGETTTIKPSSINDKNPIYTFESLNPEIATVDEATGVVTAVDYEGEATIIAKVAANEYYQAGQTEFTVTVSTPMEKTPLTFEATEDCKITVMFMGDPALEKPIVAFTKGEKQEITETTDIEVVEGQRVCFFSENAATAKGFNNNLVTILANDKPCYIYGNVMSMVTPEGSEFKDNTTFTADYALAGLFNKPSDFSNKIINHDTKKLLLPATTLTDYCYDNMFSYCTSLKAAPELPATEMKVSCYYNMFRGCSSLTSAPALPATILATDCYNNMFSKCTKLELAPALPAEALAASCYYGMFYGCTSLESAPALPATNLAEKCYYNMFYDCTSLASAPALPAETLAASCYYAMFRGCTSLASAPAISATTVGNSSCKQMFYGCTSLTTAPALNATTINSNCYQEMFNGCTSLTTAPNLPAMTLFNQCYASMFKGCTSLNNIPFNMLPAVTLATNCYNQMFSGCTSLTYAPELPALTANLSNCYRQMFYNCSNLSYVKCLATKRNSSTTDWLYGVAANGIFIKNSAMATTDSDEKDKWILGSSKGIPTGWNVINN